MKCNFERRKNGHKGTKTLRGNIKRKAKERKKYCWRKKAQKNGRKTGHKGTKGKYKEKSQGKKKILLAQKGIKALRQKIKDKRQRKVLFADASRH